MKQLLRNILTFTAFGAFFLMATATSQDECFYNMEAERTAAGLTLTNNNDFIYTDLTMVIHESIEGTAVAPSIVDSTIRYTLTVSDLGISETREFLFRDFRTADGTFPVDTLSGFYFSVSGSAPEEDGCFFDTVF